MNTECAWVGAHSLFLQVIGMKFESKAHPRLFVVIFLHALLLTGAGCDKASDLIEEAKESVSSATEDAATPDVPAVEQPSMPQQPAASAPEPPSPAEVLASFEKLKPHEITDVAIQTLASSPEAAAQVRELNLQSTNGSLSGAGLQALGELPTLTTLKLSDGKMLPAGLKSLAAATSIRNLDVTATRVDDEVLGAIASSINGLESLNLNGTKISAGAGASVSQLAGLKSLNLSGTQADDTTVAALTGLPLENIILAKTRITDTSIQALIKMPTLKELDVSTTGVTGAGFKGINRSQISSLNVSGTQFGTMGFAALKGCRKMETLHAYRAGLVQNKAANVFRSMPKLRVLNVGSNTLANPALEVFFKGHPALEELHLSNHKQISDAGLRSLVGIKTLKLLNVANCAVGPAGATELKKYIPDCSIVTSAGSF